MGYLLRVWENVQTYYKEKLRLEIERTGAGKPGRGF
jgi:hypothetical protein